MIQPTTAPTTRINGNRIDIEVGGRKKLLASISESGVSMWCKLLSVRAEVPYADLMSIPEFRAGVLAVLTSEQ